MRFIGGQTKPVLQETPACLKMSNAQIKKTRLAKC